MKISFFSIRNKKTGNHLCFAGKEETQNIDQMYTPATYELAKKMFQGLKLSQNEYKIVRWTMEDYES